MTDYMHSDDYVRYLIKNCGVRGYDFDERSAECTRPDVDMILNYVRWLDLEPGMSVLEVGCGIGRILYELHDVFGVRPSGVDMSEIAIDEARKRVDAHCDMLKAGAAETMDFADESFDRVICWGVFDLTDQTRSLWQMARVLKVGGRLLLTGKGSRFEPDDAESVLAEIGSRRKGIPNHYTDFDAARAWMDRLGLTIARAQYYRRRGDMMADNALSEPPERFYEYLLMLEKTAPASLAADAGLVVGLDQTPDLHERAAGLGIEVPAELFPAS